ncbi:MAG: galactose ABC transporter substrate-binding protein [Tissierellia bacterium]|nr:galactose ABC transporter substrate-binding protein [Tissierellia bacterium]
MNKKWLALLLAVVMIMSVFVGCAKQEAPAEEKTEEATEEKTEETTEEASGDKKKVAVFYYQYADTYISTVRAAFNEMVEKEGGIEVLEFDGMNNQATQNDQIDNAISQGVDALLVNVVDTGAAQAVIDKAKEAGLPLIFWNREPDDANVYGTYEKARFIGTKIEEAGVMQGELIKNFWADGAVDRNGNGKLDYVLLHGGQDNAEALARSQYSVKALEDAGIELNKIAEAVAEWATDKAKDAMDSWLAKDKDNIDVVIANNDGMAIGAINALQAVGLNTGESQEKEVFVGVFGVDATEEAKDAISSKTMSGTVKQDNVAMAAALYALAKNAANGTDFIEGTEYTYDDSGFAVRIPYAPFTGE